MPVNDNCTKLTMNSPFARLTSAFVRSAVAREVRPMLLIYPAEYTDRNVPALRATIRLIR